jgi:hypothetical protein
MGNDQELDLLLTQLGAAAQDAEMGTKYTALYAYDGTLDELLGPGGDEAAARALWGLDWEALRKKGQELWDRVSPRLHAAFCDEDSEFHGKLADLIKPGQTVVAAALAGLVIQAAAGLFPTLAASAVAFFIAKLIIRQFMTEAYGLACAEWEATLPDDQ